MADDTTGVPVDPDLQAAVAEVQGQRKQQTAVALRSNLITAQDADPEQEAKHLQVARTTGLPLDTVRAQPEAARLAASLGQFSPEALDAQAPATAKLLSDTQNMRMLKDVIPQTAELEQALAQLRDRPNRDWGEQAGDFVQGLIERLGGGFNETGRVASTTLGAIPVLVDKLDSLLHGRETTELQDAWFARVKAGFEDKAWAFEPGAEPGFGRRLGGAVGDAGSMLSQMTLAGPGGAAKDAGSVSEMLLNSLEHAFKSMALPATVGGLGTAQRVYNQTDDGTAAASAGLWQYLVNTAQGVMPLNAPGRVAQRMAGGAGSFILTGEGGRQVMNAVLPDGMQAPFNPDDLLINGIMGALSAGAMGPRATPDHSATVRRSYVLAAEAEHAEKTGELLTTLNQLAGESTFRERDPQGFKAFVEGIGVPDLYVDAKVLAAALDKHGVTAEELQATMPEVAQQMREGLQTEGQVRIPVEDFAAHMAGGDLGKTLLEHMRGDADGMTVAEAKAYKTDMAKQLAEAWMTTEERQAQRTAFRESAERVEKEIHDQLEATGRLTPDVVRHYAALHRAFYSAAAAQEGRLPEQVMADHPVRISAEAPAGGLAQAEPHAKITGEEFGGSETSVAELRKAARDWYQNTVRNTEIMNVASGRTIHFGRGGKAFATSADPQKIRLFAALPDLLKNGEIVRSKPPSDIDRETNVKAYHYLEGTVRIGDRDVRVDVTLREDDKGNLYYNHNPRKEDGPLAQEDRAAPAHKAGGLSNQAGTRAENVAPSSGDLNLHVLGGGEGGAVQRGSFDPATKTITLFKDANLSTFIHESGHFFLDTLAARAAGADAPAQVKADMATVLKWFGVESLERWRSMSLDEQRDSHERFARGFEAYLLEGRAPTPELQPLFSRMRSWLVALYRDLTGIERDGGQKIELDPDIRQVMDRLVASEDAIAEAQHVRGMLPLFGVKPEHMSEEEFADYRAQAEAATRAATDALADRTLGDLRWLSNAKGRALREIQRQAQAVREAIREKVTAAVDAMPVFRAKAALDAAGDRHPEHTQALAAWRAERDQQPAEGRAAWMAEHPRPERPATPTDAWKTARAAREAELVAAEKARVTEGKKGLEKGQALAKAKREMANNVERDLLAWEKENPRPKDEGPAVDHDLIAEQHGFVNGQDMLEHVHAAGDREDVIRAMTDQRMLQEHGDLTSPKAIEQAADRAIHTQARARFIATELRALAKATGSARLLAKAAEEAAHASVAQKRVREISPTQYTVSEGRAAREADKAFKAGDVQTAAVQKRAQLLSHALAKASMDAREEVAAGLKYLARFRKDSTLSKIDLPFREQILAILAKTDLRQGTTLTSLANKQSLADWVAAQRAAGNEPGIDPRLLEWTGVQSYKDMTMEEFRGLVDSVRSIEKIGRNEKEILDGAKRRSIEEAEAEVVASIGQLRQRDPTSNRGLSRLSKKWLSLKSTVASMDASLLKMEQVIDWLDGHDPNGPLNRLIFRRIAEAAGHENDLHTELTRRMRALAKDMPANFGHDLDKRLILDGLIDSKTGQPVVLLKRELIAAALNTGNESNYGKLLRGEGWSQQALEAAFDKHLTADDWKFISGTWRTVESLWPEITALERRLGNLAPEKVEPRQVTNRHGTFEGGYYPVVYDPERSTDAADRGLKSSESLFENSYQRATTSTGHTKGRVDYAAPILLSLDVLPRHLSQVTHDIAFREAIIDADRFLRRPGVRQAIEAALGPEIYRQFRPWLQAMANDRVYDARGLAFWDKVAHWARTSTTMVGLGYRFSTMAIHGATAMSNSVGEIGSRWMVSGAHSFFGSPAKMAATRDFVFERSAEMRNRMNEVDRDIRDQLREMDANVTPGVIGATRDVLRGAKRSAFYGVAMLDMASAMPTWMGAYNKAMHEGASEEDAAYAADKAVRNAHGGTGTKDLAAVQRGPEFMKLFTMFYSFWNHFYNRQRDIGRTAVSGARELGAGNYAGARRDFAMVLARSWFYFVVPQLIHAALKSKSKDDQESWLAWAAEEIGVGLFSGIPGARDVANAVSTGRDYQPTPIVSIAKTVSGVAKDIEGEIDGSGPTDRWLEHAAQTAGYVFGLPTGQAGATGQFLWDLGEGKQSPQDLADWWNGVVHGRVHPGGN